MKRSTNRLSGHIKAEIDYAFRVSHQNGDPPPLAPGDLVPNCQCLACFVAGFGLPDDARLTTLETARDLAHLLPADRPQMATDIVESYRADGLILPTARVMVQLAAMVEGARRQRPAPGASTLLPIEAARAASILEVARRHGVELRKMGSSWRGPCPLHDGEGPNFSVNPESGLYHCFVCGSGGGIIDLEMALAGVSFPDAVKVLAS